MRNILKTLVMACLVLAMAGIVFASPPATIVKGDFGRQSMIPAQRWDQQGIQKMATQTSMQANLALTLTAQGNQIATANASPPALFTKNDYNSRDAYYDTGQTFAQNSSNKGNRAAVPQVTLRL